MRYTALHTTNNRGFTLVEMLVSVALFTMVMVVALGALLSMSVSVRKAESINSTVNNLSSALDSMSRSIRTGTTYHCGINGSSDMPLVPQDCISPTTPDANFTYIDFNGQRITYCLSNPGATTCNTSSTVCGVGSCSILRSIGIGGTFVPLTSPEVNIKQLEFYVTGSCDTTGTYGSGPPVCAPDDIQPKVVMALSGVVTVTATTQSTFSLQTAVTQRIYDQ